MEEKYPYSCSTVKFPKFHSLKKTHYFCSWREENFSVLFVIKSVITKPSWKSRLLQFMKVPNLWMLYLWRKVSNKKLLENPCIFSSWRKKSYECFIGQIFFSTRGALKTQWNSSRWKNLINAQFVKKCFLRKPSWISMFLQFMEKKKPYKCSFCEKMFSLNRTLSRHSASVHEGKKPYHSSICGKCFSLNFQLKKHMISVHEWGEEIFPMQHLWS